jgi:chemotaxis methyl-accepting protein methylase
MTRTAALEDEAVDTLVACAAEWSGYQHEGVPREAVRRALARELAGGASIADVMKRAAENDPQLARTLRAAVGVHETFFFRHPQQFGAIAERALAAARGDVIRAWSAGCATGEETWSLAATLVASLPPGEPARIAVLGTDTHEPSLEVARAGVYRTNSVRASAPLLYPVVAPVKNRYEVIDALRPLTSFVSHDLRDPAPGQFEIILCRNVLVYFTRAAARIVIARLAAALAPGGLVVFGTMDVELGDLGGLVPVGPPEQMTFTNVRPPSRPRRTTHKQPPRAKSVTLPPEAIALHRSALTWIELGSRGSAEKVLADLNRRHPDYLPGILERALVHVRKGERATAEIWMTDVLRRAEALPADSIVRGLEPLPAAFYRDVARAYLERKTRGEAGR